MIEKRVRLVALQLVEVAGSAKLSMAEARAQAEHLLRLLEQDAPSEMEQRYAVLVTTCAQSPGGCFCGCHISFVDDPTPEAAEEGSRECIRSIPKSQLPGHVRTADAAGATTIGDSPKKVTRSTADRFANHLRQARKLLGSCAGRDHGAVEQLLKAISLLAPPVASAPVPGSYIPGSYIGLRFIVNGSDIGGVAAYPDNELQWLLRQAMNFAWGRVPSGVYAYELRDEYGARLDPKLSVQALGLVNQQKIFASFPTGHGG
jgi:hypothetical protein